LKIPVPAFVGSYAFNGWLLMVDGFADRRYGKMYSYLDLKVSALSDKACIPLLVDRTRRP